MSDLLFMAEYTQVIQTFRTGATSYPPGTFPPPQPPNNSIPLISGKPTFVRAYFLTEHILSGAVPGAFEIRKFTGKIMLQSPQGWITIPAINGATFHPKKAPQLDRAKFNDTMNFIIPANLCKDQLDGIFVIDDSFEPDGQLVFLFTIKFVEVPPIAIQPVLVHYIGPDMNGTPVDKQSNGSDLLAPLDYMLRASPISSFIFNSCINFDWTLTVPVGTNPEQVVDGSFFALATKLDDLRQCSGSPFIYVGVLPKEHGPSNKHGSAMCNSAAVILAQATDNMVHEIGHIFNRLHTPCDPAKDEEPLDNHYPQYFGLPRGTIGEVGVDVGEVVTRPPDRFSDVMSYCRDTSTGHQWISPYTYLHMMRAMSYGAVNVLIEDGQLGQPQEYQFTSFTIGDSTPKHKAEIRTEFSIIRTAPPMGDRESDVILQLVDKRGGIAGSFPCAPDRVCGSPSHPYRGFNVWTPVMPETDRIRILKADDVVLNQRLASRPPQIRSFKMEKTKGSHRVKLSWQCGAGKDIKYSIRFSHNGELWRALACGLDSNSFSFDALLLPGGPNCTIQLLATAGFRTSRRNIENIRLPIKPLQALIHSPVDGSEYQLGDIVYFSGAGFSPNQGVAAPDQTYWTTEPQKVLGHGCQLLLHDLPPGQHTITLHVTNGEQAEATASVRINISKSPKPKPADVPFVDSLNELPSRSKFKIQDTAISNIHDPILITTPSSPSAASGNGCGCQKAHKHK